MTYTKKIKKYVAVEVSYATNPAHTQHKPQCTVRVAVQCMRYSRAVCVCVQLLTMGFTYSVLGLWV